MNPNSYRKGANAERELADLLSEMFGVHVRRLARPYLPGLDSHSPDVFGLPGIHCESKRRRKLSLGQSIEQAARDACGNIPVVFSRANGETWVASIRLSDLSAFATAIIMLTSSQPAEQPCPPSAPTAITP